MTDYEWFSLRICLFFLPDTAAIHCGAILDNKNEKKEACSCPEGIRSPASQSNPNDRGNGDGDVDEGQNANEEPAQSEAAGNDDDDDDGASSDFESIEDVDQTDLECVCTDRYERMRIRRRQRVLREQAELSLDTQVSEKLVDPDLAVGSDRTQRHGNATGADLESVPGTTSQALLSCLQHLCFVRRKRRRVAAVRGTRYH